MSPTIQSLPKPPLIIIFSHLHEVRDRAALSVTCKYMNQVFNEGVNAAFVHIPDHRPYVQTVRMQENTHNVLHKSRKMDSMAERALWVAGCCCAAGTAVGCSASGCCCCSVSAIATKILCYTSLSFVGGGCGSVLCSIFCACCSKGRNEEVALVRRYNEEEQLLEDFSRQLQIQRPKHQLMKEPPEPSYQSGGDGFGPA